MVGTSPAPSVSPVGPKSWVSGLLPLAPSISYAFWAKVTVPPPGHQWSGCSVRIELRPRLPHRFHRPLSAMRASCAVRSSDVCSGLFLPGRLGLRAAGFYRVMRASGSAVTPLQGCRTAGPTWPPGFGFGVVLTLKNAVGTGFGPVVTHIQHTGRGGVGGGGGAACREMCKAVFFVNRLAFSIAIGGSSGCHTPRPFCAT